MGAVMAKVSLARASLRYEWRRYLPAVFAVAFSGLLVLVQAALMIGMFATTAVYIDKTDADLWVGSPGTQSIDQGQPIDGAIEAFLHMHPDVMQVEAFQWGLGEWRQPGQGKISVFLIGVQTRDGSLVMKYSLNPQLKAMLKEPNAILIDAADCQKLDADVGDSAEINGIRVKIVGLTSGLKALGGVNVVTSLTTARALDRVLKQSDKVAYFVAKLRDPAQSEKVKKGMTPKGGLKRFEVWTKDGFSELSTLFWLFESGAGIGFLFSTVIAMVVGAVITSQTLMAAVAAAIKEYATLRALGISFANLSTVVLEQSLWIGLIGLVISCVLSFTLIWLAHINYVPVGMNLTLVTFAVISVMAVALGSGLLALGQLKKVDPAALLR
jgi:putative ABC transport system permease protein